MRVVIHQDSRRSADSLLSGITKFQFFVVTKQCLEYIKGLTVSLQKRAKDICQAYSEVNTIVTALNEVRSDIDVKHKVWHDMAVTLGKKLMHLNHNFQDVVDIRQQALCPYG